MKDYAPDLIMEKKVKNKKFNWLNCTIHGKIENPMKITIENEQAVCTYYCLNAFIFDFRKIIDAEAH